ncbi:NF-X1-type zinc finger protein NFXL1 [Dissostichus eleginoides]|uniref:NF-X1-type zinc finger protein NFXL1 n=1 Tax=Dissostichus eleginoides TaxID=100907 RepID=A0AAD9BVW9_DISEL|nr:NF-X1-type zinc finger protein NFXL1 [Dissostichus eleginoides]
MTTRQQTPLLQLHTTESLEAVAMEPAWRQQGRGRGRGQEGDRPRPPEKERERPGVGGGGRGGRGGGGGGGAGGGRGGGGGGGGKMKNAATPEPPQSATVQSKFEEIKKANQAAAQRLVELRGDASALLRTGQYVNDLFQSGALTCLICIASVKRVQAKWARDSVFLVSSVTDEDFGQKQHPWPCPKCRAEYQPSETPNRYTETPVTTLYKYTETPVTTLYKYTETPVTTLYKYTETPFTTLYKYTETPFTTLYKYTETPVTTLYKYTETPVTTLYKYMCYCWKQQDPPPDPWLAPHSCGSVCQKDIKPSCGHTCLLLCHPGPCPPCPKMVSVSCLCGKAKPLPRRCSNKAWSLFRGVFVAERKLRDRVPAQRGTASRCVAPPSPVGITPVRFCVTLEDVLLVLAQSAGPVPVERLEVEKECRCGKYRKLMPCHRDFLCDSKCPKTRSCQRHQCRRKVEVKCSCGSSVLSVPCGRERSTKPPRCKETCRFPPSCHHPSREPHRCHIPPCPPCRQPCLRPRPRCTHTCPLPCHDLVTVKSQQVRLAGPWEQPSAPAFVQKALPCAPCAVPIPTACFGEHEGRFSCSQPCGRPLTCGNHTCSRECHLVTPGNKCEECAEPCLLPRPPGCSHRCSLRCHPSLCPPCGFMIKQRCYCRIIVLFIDCTKWTSADAKTKVCHPGVCEEKCQQKVKVRCPCKRIKKEFLCSDQCAVQCDDACKDQKKKVSQVKEAELKAAQEEEQKKLQVFLFIFVPVAGALMSAGAYYLLNAPPPEGGVGGRWAEPSVSRWVSSAAALVQRAEGWSRAQRRVMLSASRETCPRTRGPDVGMGVEACPHKLGSTNQLRLLLFILIPTISLLAGLLLVLALTGIFGGGVPLPSPKPIADSDPGYHGNSTSPSPSLETENVTNTLRNFSEGNVTAYNVSVSTAATATSYSSSSQATPTQPYTTTPDWLTSVTSLSTAWPISSTAATDSGVCQLIDEPQCNNMLPYNLTWLSSSVAVVKSSEVDMLLRFFGYLSRLSCYRHIMLFGCSLALPECIADTSHNRQQQSPPLIPVTHRDRSKGNHLCAA